MKKYITEFFGTFVLALTVLLSLSGAFPTSTPVLAAIVVGVLVYTMAHISGTHINPAVTIAAWSIGKIKTNDSFFYIIAQVLGGAVALQVAKAVSATPVLFADNTLSVGIFEAIGAGLLMFAVSSFIYGKTEKSTSGIVIGGGLLIGIAIASLAGTNGILNPAVALSLQSGNLMYILGPIVGAVLGAQFYKKILA